MINIATIRILLSEYTIVRVSRFFQQIESDKISQTCGREVSINCLLKLRIGKQNLHPRLCNYEKRSVRYLQRENYCKID